VPQEVDVKAIRNRLGMTQARFSDTFGSSLDAIKHWEGGRRTPEAPARTLLPVFESRRRAHREDQFSATRERQWVGRLNR